jgi:hypothetical protein
LADLKIELEMALQADPLMKANWDILQDWTENARYEKKPKQEAASLLRAIEDQQGGLLPWIKLHW